MKYVSVAQSADLAPGTMVSVEVEGQAVLLANVDDRYYAIARKCTHMGANLCKGKLEGNIVTCPMHGARFDITSGEAVGKASLLFFKVLPRNVTTYPVKIEGHQVLIGI